MSYNYKNGHGPGFDILVSTEKSEISGVCIPFLNGARLQPGFAEYIQNTPYNVYAAKHCNSAHEFTHINEIGAVNRFGWFLTREKINKFLDIGTGWFKRVRVRSFEEIDTYLEKAKKNMSSGKEI